MVGTMQNLVNEVLQSAVGNHFRNTLQALEAIRFIETRQQVQAAAFEAITGVPAASTRSRRRASTSRTSCSPTSSSIVLTQREIANQEKATYEEQQRARDVAHRDGEGEGHRRHAGAARERAGGRADQGRTRPQARRAEGRGRGGVRRAHRSGRGHAGARRSASPRPRRSRRSASPGRPASRSSARPSARAPTAIVAVANAVAEGHITVVPEVLVTGGGGGSLDGLAATLMRTFTNGGSEASGDGGERATRADPDADDRRVAGGSTRRRCPQTSCAAPAEVVAPRSGGARPEDAHPRHRAARRRVPDHPGADGLHRARPARVGGVERGCDGHHRDVVGPARPGPRRDRAACATSPTSRSA